MNQLKRLFGGDLRQFGMVFALIALIAFFQIQTGGLVLTSANMMNLLNGNSYILILAIGMVLVIIAGNIDLSVGSVAAVVGISVAVAMQSWHLPWWAGILLGLALGALIGSWQGFWVAVVGIPAFIVTLAGMMLFRGLNQFIGKSQSVPVPTDFQYIGAGYLPETGPATPFNNLTVLLGLALVAALFWNEFRRRAVTRRLGGELPPLWVPLVRLVLVSIAIAYVTWLFATGQPGTSFPFAGVILLVLVLVYSFISQRTVLGRHVYAVGGNRHAAELSGVKTRRVNFWVILNMGVLSALAGMIFVARSNASGPGDGVGWELDAIAAVFIGGAAVSGGVGTVIGSIVGGLVMAVLNNGLLLMGVGSDMTQIIKGLVLLIAVAIDVYNKTQGRPSLIGLLMRNRSVPATATPAPDTGDQAAPSEQEPPSGAATRVEAATPDATTGQQAPSRPDQANDHPGS